MTQILLFTILFAFTACNSNKIEKEAISQTKTEFGENNENPNIFWLDNFPCNIPFTNQNKPNYFEVKSIVCTGKKNGGYNLLIKCIGLTNKSAGAGITLKQKDKGNSTPKLPGAYRTPLGIEKGKEFSFDVVALFTGYFDPSKFDSFVVQYD